MAAAIVGNPLLPGYDFHRLDGLNERNVLAFVPAVTSPATPAIEAGDFQMGTPQQPLRSVTTITLNSGRMGLPYIAINIQNPPAGPVTTALCFEPGSYEVGAPTGESWYQLQGFTYQKLGQPGGGGFMYAHDPVAVQNAPLQLKKRMFRLTMTTHRCMIAAPRSRYDGWERQVPVTQPERQLMDRYRNSSTVMSKLYFLLEDESLVDAFVATVLEPLQQCVLLRVPPLHQYTSPHSILDLNMPVRGVLREHMYLARDANGHLAGDMGFIIPDTHTRRERRPVGIMHAIGTIREYQRHNAFCARLSELDHHVTIRRSPFDHLSLATLNMANVRNIAVPTERHAYLGYVRLSGNLRSGPVHGPAPGTFFTVDVHLGAAGQVRTYGMVLSTLPALLTRLGYSFILQLCMVPRQLRHIGTGPIQVLPVRLQHIICDQIPRQQLGAMRTYRTTSTVRSLVSLQTSSVVPQTAMLPSYRDIRANVTNWNNALNDIITLPNFTAAPVQNSEHDLFQQVASRVEGHIHMLQARPADTGFRSLFTLAFAAIATGQDVIFVAESLRDRMSCARIMSLWYDALSTSRNSQLAPVWRTKRILCYTDTDCPSADIDTARVNASIKFLVDDFPQHDWVAEDDANIFTPQGFANRDDLVSTAISMGHAIRSMPPTADVQGYFGHRQAVIDNAAQLTLNQIRDAVHSRRDMVRRVLRQTSILITDCSTAMSQDVQESFARPFLIMEGMHEVTFSKAVAVLVAHPQLNAAFICGADGNSETRIVPGLASSAPQNEAINTFRRSFWDALRLAGQVAHTL